MSLSLAYRSGGIHPRAFCKVPRAICNLSQEFVFRTHSFNNSSDKSLRSRCEGGTDFAKGYSLAINIDGEGINESLDLDTGLVFAGAGNDGFDVRVSPGLRQGLKEAP